jgi:hypothetical protein
MAKNMSKGRKRLLSLIFHLVVLTVMVIAYDTARSLMKSGGSESAPTEKTEKDEKVSISTGKQVGKTIGNKLSETKTKMEGRGTSMADLMEEKERRAKEKAAKLKEQEKPEE